MKKLEVAVQRPILFIGAPRSGTTVVFESIVHHEDVAWLPAQWRVLRQPEACGLYLRAFSNRAWHWVRRKRQLAGDARQSRLIPAAIEGYEFWQQFFAADIARDFLIDARPAPSESERARAWVRRLLRASGRLRFVHKFTGPGRIAFWREVFPDAVFVHLVREAPPVVSSLLRVGFWRDGGGFDRLWWRGLPSSYARVWSERKAPEVLAAVQWQAIVDVTRREASSLPKDQYCELRYEDFVTAPDRCVAGLLERCGLAESQRVRAALAERTVEDRNREAAKLSPEQQRNVAWALDQLAAAR